MNDIKPMGSCWRVLCRYLLCGYSAARSITNRSFVQAGSVPAGYGVALAALFSFSAFIEPSYAQTSPSGVEESKSKDRDLQVVVEPGDTLTAIVRRELESLDAWQQVADYNELPRPDQLVPGDVIAIPAALLNFAKIVFTKGQTTHLGVSSGVEGDSDNRTAEKGARVFVGDVLKTGKDGFVILVFKGSTTVKIQPESEVLIERLDCYDKKRPCLIDLKTAGGKLNLDVNSEGFLKPTAFTIQTPYASAAVRGTGFDYDTSENSNILGVTEGTVEISLGGNRVAVPVGKGTVAGEGKSINTLYDLPPKPVFVQADNSRFSSEDYLSWSQIDGAVRYSAALVESASNTDVLSSYQGETAAVKTDSGPGEYFIDVRAIDANGLQGFVARRTIRQQSIDENTIAPELEMELVDDILKIKPAGTGPVEVRLGNRLVDIDTDEVMLDFRSYTINGGVTFETRVNRDQVWYVLGRKVVDSNTVSRYGQLYEFPKNDN